MKFVLTGPYSNLPKHRVACLRLSLRKKFNYDDDFCIENYANDPRTTPEDKLITEILLPTV